VTNLRESPVYNMAIDSRPSLPSIKGRYEKHLYVQENFKWKLVTILTNVAIPSVINNMVKVTNEADTACLALPPNGGIFLMNALVLASQREQRTREVKINLKCMLKLEAWQGSTQRRFH